MVITDGMETRLREYQARVQTVLDTALPTAGLSAAKMRARELKQRACERLAPCLADAGLDLTPR